MLRTREQLLRRLASDPVLELRATTMNRRHPVGTVRHYYLHEPDGPITTIDGRVVRGMLRSGLIVARRGLGPLRVQYDLTPEGHRQGTILLEEGQHAERTL
jgi:hypothetical protein